jgi:hypothetical protein
MLDDSECPETIPFDFSALKPSHLTSKMKSGSSNGKRRFRSGIGWNWGNIAVSRIAG